MTLTELAHLTWPGSLSIFKAVDDRPISRREALAGLSGACVLAAVPAFPADPRAPGRTAATLMDEFAWQLLELDPSQATALGVDTGVHAALRRRLDDRSERGVEASRGFLTDALE